MEGKLQPQAVDVEEAVIGAMMLEKQAVIDCMGLLSQNSFYKESNKLIFKTIQDLFNKSEAIDLLTITNDLKSKGSLEKIGGAFYISTLTNKVASAANIDYHSKILIQKQIQREAIRICSESMRDCYSETIDPLESISKLASEVSKILTLTDTNKSLKTSEIINSIIKDIHKAKEGKDLTGVETPINNINQRFGGWQPSDLIIVAARPAMGKTAFALQCASFPVYNSNKRSLVFSLEMADKQLISRVLSQELNIRANRFTRDAKIMDLDNLNKSLNTNDYVYNDNLIIDDRAGININQLIAKSKSLHIKEPLDLIVVDYLQLLSDPSVKGNREQEISSISRKLKVLAKDLNIPVIALSQLSRAVENRGGDKRPMLSDLRESGSIEQDADIVTFLYRAEYYGLTEDENGESLIGKGSLITAKYRNGAVGEDVLGFNSEYTKFYDLEMQEPKSDLPFGDFEY